MDKALTYVANTVRGWMRWPAKVLQVIFGGRITPNQVTLVSLLGHLLVVWALWTYRPILAAIFLAFFGIMDSLDGALARLQKSSSIRGMLFDASSDRVKEVLVYIGLMRWTKIPYIEHIRQPNFIYQHGFEWMLLAACGMSLVVSYIKAKGEVALSGSNKYTPQELNKLFADGFARYEIRMALVVFGLLTDTIIYLLPVLLLLVSYTALQRITRISRALKNV